MKIKIFILTLMICTLPIYSFAFSDLSNGSTKEAVDTLSSFKIINGYEDNTFRPDKSISRAEFAAIIVAATRNNLIAYDTNKFQDVKGGYWAERYIYIARSLGIINGTTTSTFSPQKNITCEEAIKMVVAGLGYSEQAIAKGGYPEGYLVVANDLGLLKGVNLEPKEFATRGTVALIVRNALDAPFYFINDGFKEKSNQTLLQLHQDAQKSDSMTPTDETTDSDTHVHNPTEPGGNAVGCVR